MVDLKEFDLERCKHAGTVLESNRKDPIKSLSLPKDLGQRWHGKHSLHHHLSPSLSFQSWHSNSSVDINPNLMNNWHDYIGQDFFPYNHQKYKTKKDICSFSFMNNYYCPVSPLQISSEAFVYFLFSGRLLDIWQHMVLKTPVASARQRRAKMKDAKAYILLWKDLATTVFMCKVMRSGEQFRRFFSQPSISLLYIPHTISPTSFSRNLFILITFVVTRIFCGSTLVQVSIVYIVSTTGFLPSYS